MFFSQIPGHADIKKALIASVNDDRIPHAQIILGREGSGHLALTLAYISYIFCLDRQEGDSCGKCAACLKTHKLIHPDMHFSFPVIGLPSKLRKDVTSNDFLVQWRAQIQENPYFDMNDWMFRLNSENKQADINVRECIDIIKKLGLKTFESEFKVLLMWMPEYLGKEGNRLLKLIEEPTDNTFIILVARDQEKILNTILSRCQTTYVGTLPHEQIQHFLIEEANLDEVQASSIAHLADGNLNKALHLVDGDNMDYSAHLLDWMRIAYKADPVAIKAWVDQISSWSKQEQKVFLDYGILFFRSLIYYLATGKVTDTISKKEEETLMKMGSIIDLEKAESLINIFAEGIDNISRNLNSRILFMADTLHIGALMKSKEKVVTLYKI